MKKQGVEIHDAAEQVELFSDVAITEDDEGVRYSTPERVLQSKKYGSFLLRVSGELRYFKEHDDYGAIRFMQRRGEILAALWAPHLYPFENVSSITHLPEVLDRERCSFAMTVQRIEDGQVPVPRPREVGIHTAQGIFAALPNIGLSYPGTDMYDEFQWFGHNAVCQNLEWSDTAPPSITDFLGKLSVSDPKRLDLVLSGKEELPYEFEKSRMPLDYRTRTPWDNEDGHQAFGAIWVPVDELRHGIDAQVEFVMFQS